MKQQLSKHRQEQLETLLRKLRQRAAYDDRKAAMLIPVVKARLLPIYGAEADQRLSDRMFRLWS